LPQADRDFEKATLMNLSEELEKMRDAFLKRCVNFIDFQQDQGYYFDEERRYKDDLILKAKTILDGPDGDKPENVGLKFLELVKQGNFVGWQAFDAIARGGADAQHEVAVALGEMLLSKEDLAVAAAAAAERIHPILKSGRGGDNSFGLVRTLATSVLALAKPSEAIAIKTR
jgi:5-methylcytosine-specific restriction protein B